MIAGASAGVMEHLVMFPVDTIKTRLQDYSRATGPSYNGVADAIMTISKHEGIPRLYRGIQAIIFAAIPSHAVYFATYEYSKRLFGLNRGEHAPVKTAAAGSLAVLAHDAVVAPLDVVKQRLQMYNSPYRGIWDCVKGIATKEGVLTFVASYPTTVLMNIPFMSVQFATYESFKLFLSDEKGGHGLREEFAAGGIAGAMGGLVSTPLDVWKTRIQLQGEEVDPSKKRSPIGVLQNIYRTEGLKGFTRGATARVIYFIPSAAICWTTYETVKRVLGFEPLPPPNT
jgi:solute carrier family 25 iron transporter 28/37